MIKWNKLSFFQNKKLNSKLKKNKNHIRFFQKKKIYFKNDKIKYIMLYSKKINKF
jgi:hypothetical protein